MRYLKDIENLLLRAVRPPGNAVSENFRCRSDLTRLVPKIGTEQQKLYRKIDEALTHFRIKADDHRPTRIRSDAMCLAMHWAQVEEARFEVDFKTDYWRPVNIRAACREAGYESAIAKPIRFSQCLGKPASP